MIETFENKLCVATRSPKMFLIDGVPAYETFFKTPEATSYVLRLAATQLENQSGGRFLNISTTKKGKRSPGKFPPAVFFDGGQGFLLCQENGYPAGLLVWIESEEDEGDFVARVINFDGITVDEWVI